MHCNSLNFDGHDLNDSTLIQSIYIYTIHEHREMMFIRCRRSIQRYKLRKMHLCFYAYACNSIMVDRLNEGCRDRRSSSLWNFHVHTIYLYFFFMNILTDSATVMIFFSLSVSNLFHSLCVLPVSVFSASLTSFGFGYGWLALKFH